MVQPKMKNISWPAFRDPRFKQTHMASVAHEAELETKTKVQMAMDELLHGADDSVDKDVRLAIFSELKVNLSTFGRELVEHMDSEENAFVAPITRKVSTDCFTPICKRRRLITPWYTFQVTNE